MRSAFGVEHTPISKGVPKGLTQVASSKGEKANYAIERLKAHTLGQRASKKGNIKDMQAGHWARRGSKSTLKGMGAKPSAPFKGGSGPTSRIKPR